MSCGVQFSVWIAEKYFCDFKWNYFYKFGKNLTHLISQKIKN